jgi:hypothetical protein
VFPSSGKIVFVITGVHEDQEGEGDRQNKRAKITHETLLPALTEDDKKEEERHNAELNEEIAEAKKWCAKLTLPMCKLAVKVVRENFARAKEERPSDCKRHIYSIVAHWLDGFHRCLPSHTAGTDGYDHKIIVDNNHLHLYLPLEGTDDCKYQLFPLELFAGDDMSEPW